MSYDSFIDSLKFSNKTPNDQQWIIADDEGWTVAHYWAQNRRSLPVDFEYWDLADKDGWTVAHAAAAAHRLPAGFNKWLLKDNNGDTVAHIAVKSGSFDVKVFNEEVFTTPNNKGETVWDLIKKINKKHFENLRSILEH